MNATDDGCRIVNGEWLVVMIAILSGIRIRTTSSLFRMGFLGGTFFS